MSLLENACTVGHAHAENLQQRDHQRQLIHVGVAQFHVPHAAELARARALTVDVDDCRKLASELLAAGEHLLRSAPQLRLRDLGVEIVPRIGAEPDPAVGPHQPAAAAGRDRSRRFLLWKRNIRSQEHLAVVDPQRSADFRELEISVGERIEVQLAACAERVTVKIAG